MSQTVYIPLGEKSTLCLCNEMHCWVFGEQSYQCQCGRMYRKAASFAFSSSHVRHENVDGVVVRTEDFEL